MTLIQTLSDNNQTKLDNNEQQIEQVICPCYFFLLEDFFFGLVSNRNRITSSTINYPTTSKIFYYDIRIEFRYSQGFSIGNE